MSSCPICLEAELKVPAACVPCGHTFCHACITQWTRSPPRFGLSLCPQCRVPVREVQKLFISEWPVSSSNGDPPALSHLSPWQQFTQLTTLFMHFLSIPFHAVASYGPELVDRLTVWLNQQIERLIVLRTQLMRFGASFQQEWHDLGLPAQCLVGASVLLVALLLVQDLQDEDGIHRGIVLPIFLVIAHILKQLVLASAYVIYRPLNCVAACGLEVVVAAGDVGYVLGSAMLWIAFDALCIPWLVICVAARVLVGLLSVLASVVRVCMFCVVVTLLLGVPTFLASPNNQPLRAQVPALGQAVVEWVRQTLLHHSQRAAQRRQRVEEEEGRVPVNIVRDFFRLLSQELENNGREEGGGGREGGGEGSGMGDVGAERLGEGEREGEGEGGNVHRGEGGERRRGEDEEGEEWLTEGEEEEEEGENWQNAVHSLPQSLLHNWDSVDVW
ncbi:uncharacterized protein [Littorina saxatilis]|uniref:uncharacterized protein n=1 Tax=Littorina saxatilis TaxID=31220 RepID=UPI0038B5D7B0